MREGVVMDLPDNWERGRQGFQVAQQPVTSVREVLATSTSGGVRRS